MELINYNRPLRSVIRCKAKMQLMQLAFEQEDPIQPVNDNFLDEDLLQELASTLLHPEHYQKICQLCHCRQEADAIEDRIAAVLVETYQQICQRQQEPLIQQLNALL